jgi:Ca-activated chloride channel family protein
MRNWCFALGLVAAFMGVAHADDAILVLDGSGSMWGQVDGKTKAEIARSVVGDLLKQIPADRHLGLVAYGHRRTGDCTDIEELAPVGTDRETIHRRVNALSFKGKTPLTEAVRFAAERLHYREGKATVILVSDGAESCNADPCALGAELEAAGVDFTVHVVGFGLPSATEAAGLKCLAEATGGKYFTANSASELAAALRQTAAATVTAPAPQAASVLLRATDLAGGPELTAGLTWTVTSQASTPVFTRADAGVTEVTLPPGEYVVSVVRASDGLTGQQKLSAHAGTRRTVTIPLEMKLDASIVLTPAGQAPAASTVSVDWTGPDRRGDYVTVVKAGATVTEYLDYKETGSGNPVQITMPPEPGNYEMRYVLGQPQRVLASVPLKVVATRASVSGPPTAQAGSRIAITWTGPANPGDWITIVKPDVPYSAYGDYFDARPANNQLNVPLEPGDYELRYVLAGKRIIARAPIKVLPVTVTLQGPDSVAAGSSFEVGWNGPGNQSDWITIIAPDQPDTAYASYADALRGNPATLTASETPGDYELRYVLNGKQVLARIPIRVLPVTVTLQAPEQIAAGTAFEVGWNGPNNPGDWVTIVAPDQPENAYASYADAPRANPATLTAPATPGSYELRYVLNGRKVVGRKAIEVIR